MRAPNKKLSHSSSFNGGEVKERESGEGWRQCRAQEKAGVWQDEIQWWDGWKKQRDGQILEREKWH